MSELINAIILSSKFNIQDVYFFGGVGVGGSNFRAQILVFDAFLHHTSSLGHDRPALLCFTAADCGAAAWERHFSQVRLSVCLSAHPSVNQYPLPHNPSVPSDLCVDAAAECPLPPSPGNHILHLLLLAPCGRVMRNCLRLDPLFLSPCLFYMHTHTKGRALQ